MAKEYFETETLGQMAQELIKTYHPELLTAKIKYLWVTEGTTKGAQKVYGTASKVSPVVKLLTGFDFIIIMAMDFWKELDATQQQAALDSKLECCTGKEDEKTGEMTWVIRQPDILVHTDTVRRWGAWQDSLVAFVSVAKELDLNEDFAEGMVN